MAKFQMEFKSVDVFRDALKGFNPSLTKIREINGRDVNEFGLSNTDILTFDINPDLVPDTDDVVMALGKEKANIREKRKSFVVSDGYVKQDYDSVFDNVLDGVKQKMGQEPTSIFAQFHAGRIQTLLNFGQVIEFDPTKHGLVTFEESVAVPALLDYTERNPVESYGSSLLLDMGYNGKNAIRIAPTMIRIMCRNLMISVRNLMETDSIRHLGDMSSKIYNQMDDITDKTFEDYMIDIKYGEFEKWVEKFYGKKAVILLNDIRFKADIKKKFKAYYAMQFASMLNRGFAWETEREGKNGVATKELSIGGFGLDQKSQSSFKQILALAA